MKQAISKETIARTAALFVALINQVIVVFGGDAFPFTQDQVYQAGSTIITVCLSIWSWWKNNSFTKNAIVADRYKETLKEIETKSL